MADGVYDPPKQRDEYGKPVPKDWKEAVRDAGSEARARIMYPTIDPAYQKLVKEHGQAKGTEMYAKQYVDPASGNVDPGLMGYLPGSAGYKKTIDQMQEHGGLEGDVGSWGQLMLGGADAVKKLVTGTGLAKESGGSGDGSAPAVQPGARKPTGPSVAAQQQSAASQAADQMMKALAGEYTGEMASMMPYMSGSAGVSAGQAAQKMGQSISGTSLPGQDPAYAAQLAGPQNTVAQAMQAGSKSIAQGLADLGKADAAYMQTAPYQGLLQALQSEGQYKIETGAAVPNVSSSPKWAQAAYADVLGATPSAASGASSVTNPQPQLAAQQAAQTSPSTDQQGSTGSTGGSG